jgi:hypothetical protein
MKALIRTYSAIHALTALLFAIAAIYLICVAAHVAFSAMRLDWSTTSAQHVIEAMGLLAAAVVALQISQTITEEEVIRDAHISAPTRVRRFLSRFFVVVVVALALEGLVATFKALHEDLSQLIYASAILVATGVVLAMWGLFIRFNTHAETLEPEAMQDAKEEDRKLK